MKKTLLFSLILMIFVCAFAISASAEDKIIKLSELPTLEQIHENPDAYISHLDCMDTSTLIEKDPNSVVVLSDLQETPTYYVFPSFYILSNNYYYPRVSLLNDKISAADPTAYAEYPGSGSRGSNQNIIRLEMPTYVTELNGNAKFESSSNIKEVYFPTKLVTNEETGETKEVTCITTVTGANTFSSCSSLEVIHNFNKLPMGIYNNDVLSGCKSLKEIKLHDNLTSITSGLFSGCKSLGNIKIPDGVVSIGSNAFNDCDSMTEIILPNGCKSAGKHAFGSCDNLVTLSFGASFEFFSRANNDYEITQGSNNLKYIYMPESMYEAIKPVYNDYKSSFSSGKNVTFFFTGSSEKAQILKDSAEVTKANGTLAGATLVPYDPNQNYEGYADTLGQSIVVYNYNKCEAFYNGEHKMSDVTYQLPENYISNAYDKCVCTQCQLENIVKTYNPIITLTGFSAKEDDKKVCMTYKLDKEAIEKYEAETGKELSIGVTAAADFDASLTEYESMNSDLTPIGKAIVAPVNKAYGSFDFVLSGFTAEHYAKALVMCAYVSDGASISYIDTDCKSKATVFTFAEKIA